MAEIRRRDARREDPVETIAIPQEAQEETIEPKVSAILIVFNQATALRRAVQALERSQDRERLEILVVDCGSQDGSSQIDSEYEGVTVLRLPMHLGATRAMNIGTRTAKADLVLYLSPNVEVAPDTVNKLAERLESDADAAAVCPLLSDPQGQVVSRDHNIRAMIAGGEFAVQIDATRDCVEMEHPGLDALMARKQFIKSMNYFDERYGHAWADADMAMQVRRAQKRIKLYPSIGATYHEAPDPNEGDPLFEADRVLGAAAFVGKYDGFFAGLMFRIGAIFRALGRFDFRQIGPLVSGQKLDGSQAM